MTFLGVDDPPASVVGGLIAGLDFLIYAAVSGALSDFAEDSSSRKPDVITVIKTLRNKVNSIARRLCLLRRCIL